MTLDTIEKYFRAYDKNVYAVFAQQGSEPDMAQLEAFESEIGFRLPVEFRTFALHPLGGLYIEVKENLWPRAKEFAVGPFWSFLYGMYVYSLSKDAPEWLDMRRAWQEMSEAGYPQRVPFMKVIGDADPYCFTQEGIVIHRHETPDEPEPITSDFYAIFMKEVRALEERKDRKLAGES